MKHEGEPAAHGGPILFSQQSPHLSTQAQSQLHPGTVYLSSLLSAGEDTALVKSQLCPGPARTPPGTLNPSV